MLQNNRTRSQSPTDAVLSRLATGARGLLVLLALLLPLSQAQAQDMTPPASNGASDVQAPTSADAEDVRARVDQLDEPLYNPFVERYLLDEVKTLRTEIQSTRAELIEKVVDKELTVADKTMSYATDTVTYFFYLIAGATSILVVIGWNSIRDMRNQLASVAEKRVNELVVEYEQRLKFIEEQLQQKSDIINRNQEEIERTNEVHSLWLKASQETSQQNKIAVYDQILDLRPDDVEALSYKADAVLELNEPLWAISLCLRALKLAPDNGHPHYQLACAYAEIGRWEDAIKSLSAAIDISEAYRDDASVDPSFAPLHDFDQFRQLVHPEDMEESENGPAES